MSTIRRQLHEIGHIDEIIDNPKDIPVVISVPIGEYATFTLGSFMGNCISIKTSKIATEILNMVITYKKTGTAVMRFDENGSEFYVTITPQKTIICANRDKTTIHCITINGDALVKRIVIDIQLTLHMWARDSDATPREAARTYRMLSKKLKEAASYVALYANITDGRIPSASSAES